MYRGHSGMVQQGLRSNCSLCLRAGTDPLVILKSWNAFSHPRSYGRQPASICERVQLSSLNGKRWQERTHALCFDQNDQIISIPCDGHFQYTGCASLGRASPRLDREGWPNSRALQRSVKVDLASSDVQKISLRRLTSIYA